MKKSLIISLLCAVVCIPFLCLASQRHNKAQSYPASVKKLLAKLSNSYKKDTPRDFAELFSEALELANEQHPNVELVDKITPAECEGLAFYLKASCENTIPLRAIGTDLRKWLETYRNYTSKYASDDIHYTCVTELEKLLKPTVALTKLGGKDEFPRPWCVML